MAEGISQKARHHHCSYIGGSKLDAKDLGVQLFVVHTLKDIAVRPPGRTLYPHREAKSQFFPRAIGFAACETEDQRNKGNRQHNFSVRHLIVSYADCYCPVM